jgi:hypothetical protein
MNAPVTLQETSFTVTPLPAAVADRIRTTRRDDFGRTVLTIVAQGSEPVRDQLRRVAAGERIILCSYQTVPLPSAFAEIGPIYICAEPGATAPRWTDELPPGYFNRTFALRAYNAANEIIDSTLVEPAAAPALIRRWLGRPEVSYLHARFAGHGCFACRFDRTTP